MTEDNAAAEKDPKSAAGASGVVAALESVNARFGRYRWSF
jgi:hypothetical protein